MARKGPLSDEWVWEVGESECRAVIARIGVRTLPRLDKRADFRQVLDHEKGAETLNRRGYLDDVCLWQH